MTAHHFFSYQVDKFVRRYLIGNTNEGFAESVRSNLNVLVFLQYCDL